LSYATIEAGHEQLLPCQELLESDRYLEPAFLVHAGWIHPLRRFSRRNLTLNLVAHHFLAP
jgi:hypothetical protein